MVYQPPSEKWRCFKNIRPFHAKRFTCCALTIQYITYSMVDQSIVSISDLGGIFSSALCASVNMAFQSDISAIDLPTVLYILYILAESPPSGWVPSLSIGRVFFKS